jgi:hypothetical protein
MHPWKPWHFRHLWKPWHFRYPWRSFVPVERATSKGWKSRRSPRRTATVPSDSRGPGVAVSESARAKNSILQNCRKLSSSNVPTTAVATSRRRKRHGYQRNRGDRRTIQLDAHLLGDFHPGSKCVSTRRGGAGNPSGRCNPVRTMRSATAARGGSGSRRVGVRGPARGGAGRLGARRPLVAPLEAAGGGIGGGPI